jgi:two-component system chemotaxis sensor kinase CheA
MTLDHSLFDSLLEPVFVLSEDGKVVYCNEPAGLVCDFSVRKIRRGMFFKDLLTFDEPVEWIHDIRNVTGQAPYKETGFTTHSGEHGKVQITIQPLSTGLWIVFVRDVTLEERLQKKYRAELGQKEDVILALQKAQLELEEYSKNLERMVQERTKQISHMNRLMKALLDSLSQGFFIFDKTGLCLEVTSKACESTVEHSPTGKKIWDVLKLAPDKINGFERWMTTLFSEMLPFSDLAPLGPASYPHSEGLNISLDYFPLRNEENQIDGVVVVASDITNLVEAQRQAVIEKQHSEMIISLVRSKNQVSRFVREAQSLLQELQGHLSKSPVDGEAVFRCLHTLKGGAGMLSILGMTDACHSAESFLSEYNKNPQESSAVALRGLCEMVTAKFLEFKEEAKEVLGPSALSDQRLLEIPSLELQKLLQRFQAVPEALPLAEEVLGKFLREPVETFFLPYKEVAFKLAANQNKLLREVSFTQGSISVVPEIYSSLFSTFVHAFRNAIDHGLETPEERTARGKPEGGELHVAFEVLSAPERLRISVSDDGRGIDPEKIRAKLIAKNPGKAAVFAAETHQEVLQHIFDSQFSTNDTVTAISGRGVGLDAIKSEAVALGGQAWVVSRPGFGSTITVEVPLLQHSRVRLAS